MSRLSDFQPQDTSRNVVLDSLLRRNAERVSSHVDWRETHISETIGAAESRPYARDEAIKDASRRKHLHKMLDAMCSDSNIEEGEQTKKMHAALDRLLDEREARGPEGEEEPDEEWPDAQEERESDSQEALDALALRVLRKINGDTSSKPRHIATRRSGYITDSDYVAKYLNPDMTCIAAENQLRDRVYKEQANNANRSYWCGLFYFLRNQPDGSRVKDCKPDTLSMLISKTLAA